MSFSNDFTNYLRDKYKGTIKKAPGLLDKAKGVSKTLYNMSPLGAGQKFADLYGKSLASRVYTRHMEEAQKEKEENIKFQLDRIKKIKDPEKRKKQLARLGEYSQEDNWDLAKDIPESQASTKEVIGKAGELASWALPAGKVSSLGKVGKALESTPARKLAAYTALRGGEGALYGASAGAAEGEDTEGILKSARAGALGGAAINTLASPKLAYKAFRDTLGKKTSGVLSSMGAKPSGLSDDFLKKRQDAKDIYRTIGTRVEGESQPKNAGLEILKEQSQTPEGKLAARNELEGLLKSKNIKTNPDGTITVYRGGDIVSGDAFSVTLDKNTAKEFGKVQEIKIKPDNVIATGKGLDPNELIVSKALTATPKNPPTKTKNPEIEIPSVEPKIANPEKTEEALDILTAGLEKSKASREATTKLRKTELARRVAIAESMAQKGEGTLESYQKSRAALKNKLPEAKFEPIEGLTEEHINSITQTIHNTPNLNYFKRLQAIEGFERMIGVRKGAPQKKQLELLSEVFGDRIADAVKSPSKMEKLRRFIAESVNLPRVSQTIADFSAPFRQGLFMLYKPKQFAKSFGKMFEYAFSEKSLQEGISEIQTKKLFGLMRDSGLEIIQTKAGKLSGQEERFMSNWIRKIPIAKNIARVSERAHEGFLNKLRADTFEDIAQRFIDQGYNPVKDANKFKSLAKFINSATGRGKLPKILEGSKEIINGAVFAPRFAKSRIDMVNPLYYASLDKSVRGEMMKSWLTVFGVGVTAIGIAKMAGADVEIDPRSTDWGKIKVGNTRLDPWAGTQQIARTTAQLITGQTKSSTSGIVRELSAKKFPFDTRLDVLGRFGQSKTSPIAGLTLDLLRGETMVGEELTPSSVVWQRLAPLYIQDIREAYEDMGGAGVALTGIPGIFGVGVQTYGGKKKSKRKDLAGSLNF